jgi:hypothetical protein
MVHGEGRIMMNLSSQISKTSCHFDRCTQIIVLLTMFDNYGDSVLICCTLLISNTQTEDIAARDHICELRKDIC